MGVIGKLQVELDIKSNGDLFFELCAKKPHLLSKIIPSIILASELLDQEGELAKPGSILYLIYKFDGKKCVTKKLVDEIDEENKYLRLDTMEGPSLKELKSLAVTLKVVIVGEITRVKWIIEFEKIEDNGPYPTKIADLLVAITKGIENHHLNA